MLASERRSPSVVAMNSRAVDIGARTAPPHRYHPPMERKPEEGPPSPEPVVARDEDTFVPTTSKPPPAMPAENDLADGGRPSRLSMTGVRKTLVSLSDIRPSLTGMRATLVSMLPWQPRWKPWSPLRAVAATLAFATVMSLVVLVGRRVPALRKLHPIFAPASARLELDEVAPPPPVVAPRADAKLDREHRSPVAGGLLTLPPSFASSDGAYDLVIHFHGNTDLVEESYAASKLNAVVIILNLGVGSGPYEDRFANPLRLPEMLDRANATMERRGLVGAKRRRLALAAWSAGYGAVLKVLDHADLAARVDAVLLLDGIHVGYRQGTHDPLLDRLAPFTRFAREAVLGKKLFAITHSSITPNADYAGTRDTTNALLREVGVERVDGGSDPPMPVMKSIDGVIAKKSLVALKAESVADRGGLHVHGYRGDQPEHHTAHLVQMSTTALPDLVAYWGSTR